MSDGADIREGCLTRVVILPLVVIVLAVGAAVLLVKMKPKAQRAEVKPTVVAVDVVTVEAETINAQLYANGTVRAAQEVTLSPEVSGRLTYVSDALVEGGRVKRGQLLARIDPTDYEIAVEVETLRVEQADVEIVLEKGRGDVARREYNALSKAGAKAMNALALREPQMKKAQSAKKSAEVALRRAEKNLERTSIYAPFNALVTRESIERGGVVSPGMQLATLIGTDAFWIEAQVPTGKLPLLAIPDGTDPKARGAKVHVVQELGEDGARVEREGRVVRLAGRLDAESRTATVIVEVTAPLAAQDGEIPLFPDAFVTVGLEGEAAQNVVKVPERALSERRFVHVVDDGKLRRVDVQVGWRTPAGVYLRSGLEGGEQVIVSPLSNPLDGMAVSVRRDLAKTTAAKGGEQ